MATVIIMPRQGQSVESCIITEWKKAKGDAVKPDDVLFSYETDKSTFDEKANTEGTILEIFAADGDDVPCLEPVCIIGTPGEDISALIPQKGSEPASSAQEATAPVSSAAPSAVPQSTVSPSGNPSGKASPRAKALAEKTGADIRLATATGPDGRVIERDVNALLDAGIGTVSATPAAPETIDSAAIKSVSAQDYVDVPLSGVRKVIAKSMHASLSSMAQLTLNASFDATELQEYRAQLKANAEEMNLANITLNDMVLYAVSRALKHHPDLNAHYLDDKIRRFAGVNLGIAVDTDRGLLVPTLFGADRLTLNELSIQAKDLIKQAQAGTISPDLLKGASFTVTNLGSLGVESFTPVINPPQTAILGVDTITKRVREKDGAVALYPAMGLSLTFDHRAVDGAPAARLLKEICTLLEHFRLTLAV